MNPDEVLMQAAELVTGPRAASHGDYHECHQTIAALWSVVFGITVTAKQVAICMALLKVARMLTGTHNSDDHVDGAAYLAMGESL